MWEFVWRSGRPSWENFLKIWDFLHFAVTYWWIHFSKVKFVVRRSLLTSKHGYFANIYTQIFRFPGIYFLPRLKVTLTTYVQIVNCQELFNSQSLSSANYLFACFFFNSQRARMWFLRVTSSCLNSMWPFLLSVW